MTYDLVVETKTVEDWLRSLPDGSQIRILKTAGGGLAMQELPHGQVYIVNLGTEEPSCPKAALTP